MAEQAVVERHDPLESNQADEIPERVTRQHLRDLARPMRKTWRA
jgi:hypothetical protein